MTMTAQPLSIQQIIYHERLGMMTRRLNGYDQHDDHLWRWLNYHLQKWSAANPVRIVS